MVLDRSQAEQKKDNVWVHRGPLIEERKMAMSVGSGSNYQAIQVSPGYGFILSGEINQRVSSRTEHTASPICGKDMHSTADFFFLVKDSGEFGWNCLRVGEGFELDILTQNDSNPLTLLINTGGKEFSLQVSVGEGDGEEFSEVFFSDEKYDLSDQASDWLRFFCEEKELKGSLTGFIWREFFPKLGYSDAVKMMLQSGALYDADDISFI